MTVVELIYLDPETYAELEAEGYWLAWKHWRALLLSIARGA